MSRPNLGRVLFLLTLLTVGSQANPIGGRKRSFGMGLMGGAMLGGVLGHAIAKGSGSSKPAAPAAAPVAQVVENGVPDAHGCYRQTIKEPVVGHRKLYTETVHLVCPNGSPPMHAQPVGTPAQVFPVGHSPVAVHHVVAVPGLAPSSNHTESSSSSHSNGTQTQTVLVHPGPAPGTIPAPPRPPGSSIVYANSPPVATHHSAPVGVPHVVLISKTVKKQKSAAASLNVSYGLLIVLVLYCLIRK